MTDYHWTPANQRLFLEALAETGCVSLACAAASMSRRAAYNLRNRKDGAAFRMGWDAAQLVARCVVADTLMERALLGQTVEVVRDPETHTSRSTRFDAQLGRALLTRLDRLAEGDARPGSITALARVIAQDFESFLDLIERGGAGSEAALFITARDENTCELARNSYDSGDFGDDDTEQDDIYDPNDICNRRADRMDVWFDEDRQDWRTNFPPVGDCDVGHDDEVEDDNGTFGQDEYSRPLTAEEAAANEAMMQNDVDDLRARGEVQRRLWFGFAEKGEDRAAAGDIEVKSMPESGPTSGPTSGPHAWQRLTRSQADGRSRFD
jgi:hypothetical protein